MSYFIYLISMLSAAFALGGTTNIYFIHRTKVLLNMMLFLLSLFLISLGNFFMFYPVLINKSLLMIFSFAGVGLNIGILPYLISALFKKTIKEWLKRLHHVWCGLFLVFGFLFFLYPSFKTSQYIISTQQLLTIAISLAVMAVLSIKHRKTWWYLSLMRFFKISLAFLLLLLFDMMISFFDISIFKKIDNLSLPIYMAVLSVSAFIFSSRYLSRGVLIKDNKLTEACISYYKLTQREVEIVEKVADAKTNKEVADILFISTKTVENHLYKIYQKFDVTTRQQLLQTLTAWKTEKKDR